MWASGKCWRRGQGIEGVGDALGKFGLLWCRQKRVDWCGTLGLGWTGSGQISLVSAVADAAVCNAGEVRMGVAV